MNDEHPHLEHASPPKKSLWQRWLDWNGCFFVISLLFHILLIVLATLLIVQVIGNKPKLKFTAAPPIAAHPDEFKVKHSKKMASDAPAVSKRITTTALNAQIALPAMDITTSTGPDVMASVMSGLGASGLGAGAGAGGGIGSMPMEGMTAFGFKGKGKGFGLPGNYYNLLYNRDRGPSGANFYQEVVNYIKAGMPDDYFKNFYKGSQTLYIPQIGVAFVEMIEAAKAFADAAGDKAIENPACWVAVYKGKFTVNHTGTYRLVGFGDDLLAVSIDHKEVLESIINDSAGKVHVAKEYYPYTGGSMSGGSMWAGGASFPCGDWVELEEGTVHEINVLIGDDAGTSAFWVMVERKGQNYKHLPNGSPILPLLRFSSTVLPQVKGKVPPYDNETDIGWRIVNDSYKMGDTVSESRLGN